MSCPSHGRQRHLTVVLQFLFRWLARFTHHLNWRFGHSNDGDCKRGVCAIAVVFSTRCNQKRCQSLCGQRPGILFWITGQRCFALRLTNSRALRRVVPAPYRVRQCGCTSLFGNSYFFGNFTSAAVEVFVCLVSLGLAFFIHDVT